MLHVAGVQRLLDLMLRAGTLNSVEVQSLMRLLDDQDPVMMAACQVHLTLKFAVVCRSFSQSN